MIRQKFTTRRRTAAVGAFAAGAVLLCAAPAFAHVTVDPEEAEQGGFATVDFKVPNERDDASTTKVEVNFPTDQPLASVMPQPVPGWDVKVTKSKLDKPLESHGEKITEAVTKITWSGGKIGPGEFQQFPVSMGALPHDADVMAFKALQTYDNDEVVRWIEEPEKGKPEPESPAPVLHLTPAGDSAHGGAAAAGEQQNSGDGEQSAAGSGGGTDTTARVLGGAGIAVGVAGVAFGLTAGRRRAAQTSSST
ncbi:YcnI family protein [Streptomyces sp. HNM0574]|uniref:YcnI family copper-binding membrane protein n=1 Tax=Streptomyces sp. HNM0574 TaxID=2714954 RepID=UPI00146B8A31|nr:YcnI family protein [Streptomyces sp. HNM0574]NLU69641.1 YcnI family protein [Streptomyces sp. HNM0574]